MKRLVFIINYIENNGPTMVLKNLAFSLDKKDFDVIVLTLFDKNSKDVIKEFEKHDIEVLSLNIKSSIIQLLKNRSKIIQKIKNISPDIIHTHGYVPTILLGNSFSNINKITTIHNNMLEDYIYTYGKLKGRILVRLHIHFLKKFDHVICCSETSYNYLKNSVKNATYIRNGIDINCSDNKCRQEIRKNLEIPLDAIVYIYVGMLSSRKKVLELLELFDNYKNDDEYLIVLGDGDLKDKCQKYDSSQIKILGFKDNPIDYMQASDVYTSNSGSEGFSISIIEALECGLYLLLSEIPSHIECFNIDSNYYIGEFFSSDTYDDKKKLLRLKMSNDRKKLIKKFKKVYLSSEKMKNEYKKYY